MTYRIHLTGIVQGVGFRPMVFMAAKKFGVNGSVSNSSSGVEILFNADDSLAQQFYQSILQSLPANSRVLHHQMTHTKNQTFEMFSIVESTSDPTTSVLLSPDFALCKSCREELHDPANRRYQYAFTTCTQCGPRYSVTNALPYDRIHTTMQPFQMCIDCQKEYDNPFDRRFYSQTNSCCRCGIKMSLHLPSLEVIEDAEVIDKTIDLIQTGKIVAVKGVGGFLLLCDATNADVILRLRERKHRPTKPFALLYPNEDLLKGDVELNETEHRELNSPVAPIVLVRLKYNSCSGVQSKFIAPGLHSLGAMLPYAPLLEQIATGVNKPVIATSANISNAPIVYRNEDALRSLFSVADAVLVHNRDIVIPQDDSVVRFSNTGSKIIIRRSRGWAPTFFPSHKFPEQCVLAMGAQLKSTVTLLHLANVYISQYIGDLENADTEKNYKTVFQHLLKITGARPELILVDSHPDYASTTIGNEFGILTGTTAQRIQHHRAHFAAVLAENNLMDTEKPILGVIWDGVGLGDDGASWGGEFFSWEGQEMNRVQQLSYFPLLLGDKMAREPRLCAFTLSNEPDRKILASRFTTQEWKVYSSALKTETIKTSSMGRVFDAVAAWCGLCDKVSYEGEAALLLEEAANEFFRTNEDYFESYPLGYSNGQVDTLAFIKEVINDVVAGTNRQKVAARFHCTLVKLIEEVALVRQIQSLAFSGGVFQNALLVRLIEKRLSNTFKLYFHQQLSPNDECISFGQLAYWSMCEKLNTNKSAIKNLIYAESEQQ